MLTLLAGGAIGWKVGPTTQLVLVISTIYQIVNAAIRVCIISLTPALVDQKKLTETNGWLTVVFQGGYVSGVICSGVLLDYIGFSFSLVVAALSSFFASYAYMNVTRGISLENIEGLGGRQSITFGRMLRRILASPKVVWLIVIGAIDLILIGLFNMSSPPLVARFLGGSSTALADVGIVFASGSIFMGFIIGKYKLSAATLERWLWLPPVLFSFISVEFVYFNLISYLFLAFFFGASVALLTVYCTSIVQEIVPSTMRGRFSAVRRMTSGSLVSLAAWFFASGYSVSLNMTMLYGFAISMNLVLLVILWSVLYKPARRGVLGALLF
jgi:uncharacterized membrane protein YuzA (DUF378 family)